MIEKLSVREVKKFLSNHFNKTMYPRLHAMMFHYYDLYEQGKSQYVIKGKKVTK